MLLQALAHDGYYPLDVVLDAGPDGRPETRYRQSDQRLFSKHERNYQYNRYSGEKVNRNFCGTGKFSAKFGCIMAKMSNLAHFVYFFCHFRRNTTLIFATYRRNFAEIITLFVVA